MKMRFWALILPFSLAANPQSAVVAGGEAVLAESGPLLEVKVSDRAILNWDSFSIQNGEITRFIQPSSTSAVLNRVTGAEISQIHGLLEANGIVYLSNPNGVVIGKEGQINAAAFFGCTLALPDTEFLKGENLLLTGEGTGDFVHLGEIRAQEGSVALIGHRIVNQGVIEASEGKISLISGHEVLLQPNGEIELYIRPDLEGLEESQEGAMKALEVQLASEQAMQLAIYQGGDIEILREGGKILIVAQEGDISFAAESRLQANKGEIEVEAAKNLEISGTFLAEEGKVSFLADEIVGRKADIDVSGKEGKGGEILIGGKWEEETRAARSTFLDSDVVLRADALGDGDAGTLLVWAEKETTFHGSFLGRAVTGKGAFAEVSAQESLVVTGHADLRSETGLAGELLLDPGAVTIQQAGSLSGPNTFSQNYINTQLGMGSLTINTANSTAGTTETITINNDVAISWSAATTLTLIAGHSIVVNLGGPASITNTNAGTTNFDALIFQASGNGGGGNMTAVDLADIVISMTCGNVTMTGSTPQANANIGISLNAGTIATQSGNISLTGTGGGGAGTNNGVSIGGTNAVTTQTGTITISGTAGFSGVGNDGIGVLLQGGDVRSTSALSSNNISLTGSGKGSTGAGIYITSGAAVTMAGSGTISMTGTSGDQAATTGYGVFLDSDSVITGTGSASISITGTGATSGSSSPGISITGDISTASGALSMTGTGRGTGTNNYGIYIGGGTASLTSTTGTITLQGTGSSSGTNSNVGIYVADPVTTAGTIAMTGTGGGSGTGNHGISFASNMTPASGVISLTGTGSSSGTSSHGIFVPVITISTTGAGANISLTGTASGATSNGIYINGGTLSTQSANLTLSGGSSTGTDCYGILVNNTSSLSTTSGTLSTTSTASDTLLGGSATLQTTTGALTISSQRDLSTEGAIIRTTSGAATSSLTLIANRTLNLDVSRGSSQITQAGSGTLYLVVDNAYPSLPSTLPTYGSGQFNLSSNTTLTAAGELRIYTAIANQNTISAATINGVSSTSLPSVSNVYYPSGSYVGPGFTIYYKPTSIPMTAPPPVPPVVQQTIQAAIAEPIATTVSDQISLQNNSTTSQQTSTPEPSSSCTAPSVSVSSR